jgi:hypothetical protein
MFSSNKESNDIISLRIVWQTAGEYSTSVIVDSVLYYMIIKQRSEGMSQGVIS